MLTKETEAVWQGGAFAPYKRFAAGKTLDGGGFTSPPSCEKMGLPARRSRVGLNFAEEIAKQLGK